MWSLLLQAIITTIITFIKSNQPPSLLGWSHPMNLHLGFEQHQPPRPVFYFFSYLISLSPFKIRATPATLPCFSFFKVILRKKTIAFEIYGLKKTFFFRFCLFLFSNKHCLRNTNSLDQNWDVIFQCSWTLEDNIAISICFKES